MSAPVAPGDVLGGKYRVDRVLGVGGMGVVVAATHMQLDQRVALKFMLPQAFAEPAAMARFKREARAAVKLRSEHVARVLDIGTFDTGSPYIVMEFLEGTDLAHELARTGPMPPQVAAEYLLQACEAIAEAHSLGIVHRDLKPANLFLTRRPDGSPLVKVLDFGISKANALADSGGLEMTKTNAMLGSPLYMSPEQMRSSKNVDARTDVWSLGIILYELLGGRVPFNADTLGELIATVITEPHPPLLLHRADVPPELSVLVDRCLAKDRARRCASVAEIATALAPFCPSRVLPIVERITAMLGASTPSAVGPTERAPAMAQPVVAPVQTAPVNTAPGWGATGGSPTASGGAKVAVLSAVGGAVLVGAIGLVAFFEVRGRSRSATESIPVATATASAAAVGVASAAPAPSAASAAPVDSSAAPVESASAAAVAEASASARGKATPGRGKPTPTPPAPAKPTATATASAAPAAPTPAAPATTAAPQKPGMLDTSN